MKSASLCLLFGIALFVDAPGAIAGKCTQEEKTTMRQAGFSEQRIQEICPDVQFPIWDRDGNMLYTREQEYVGPYLDCRYKKYGSECNACIRSVQEEQRQREQIQRRREEAWRIEAAKAAERRRQEEAAEQAWLQTPQGQEYQRQVAYDKWCKQDFCCSHPGPCNK